MNKIPNTLKEHRLRKGLVQLDVANYLGFRSTDRISRWEAGVMYPHIINALKLAKFYGVSIEDLYPIKLDELLENSVED